MKTLHGICLSMVLVATGLVLVAGQEAFGAERSASGRGQRGRGGQRDMWSFEKDKAGSVPQGWKVAETAGKGTPATWQVVKDDSAPDGTQAVAITANKNRGSTYNLMIAQDTSYKTLQMTFYSLLSQVFSYSGTIFDRPPSGTILLRRL